MDSKEGARRIFLALILVALGLAFAVVLPFGAGLVFAMVLAGACYPLHIRLTKKLRGRANLSAGILCAGVLLLFLLPLGGMSAFIVAEVANGVNFIADTVQSEGMSALVGHLPSPLQRPVKELIATVFPDPANMDAELRRHAGAHGSQVARFMSRALAATGTAAFQSAMALIAFFFFLVDGSTFVRWIEDNSPLMRGQVGELLAEFRKVSTAVLVSSLVTSGVQALTALIGYVIAGVPQSLFFGLVTFVVAFIPAVGAGGACLVAALLLLAIGKVWAAFFLALWIIPVGLVDNFVKPLLVKRGVHMHGGIVFFSLIGGIATFGMVGLLLGPLIVTFLVGLVRMYRRDFSDSEENDQETAANPAS
jgi:predicted PurR-regulated permease PerM